MKRMMLFLFAISCVKLCACSCGPTPSTSEAFDRAKAVFVGRVIRTELLPDPKDSGYEFLECTFELQGPEHTFKGAGHVTGVGERRLIVVRTGKGGGDCGFPFALNRLYLVYASGDTKLSTSICTRNQPYESVDGSELKALRLLMKKE